MHHHYQFMARLQQAIALQTGTLDLHVRQIEERAVALRNAEARLGSLKQVLQRRVQEQQVHERRAEQKQVDEIAALQYRKLTRGQLAGGF
jgi:flagellar FliJ protein